MFELMILQRAKENAEMFGPNFYLLFRMLSPLDRSDTSRDYHRVLYICMRINGLQFATNHLNSIRDSKKTKVCYEIY